ncbi:dihydrofolate reductase family protein [Nonomuraea basaltis]|uniref:dihydrofolate reductase family protein n=1 Tax=Nonomuraea basaltis TaxID=2495887 RepID=UPI00110C49F3|nr:dihydrofolate reductase family protein [Nonomuraea basaltis]TMR93136.1 hypothetical protein EJK15_40780 [Nonomuraea basaltis]
MDAGPRQGRRPAVEREFAQFYKETPRYVFSDTLQTVPEGLTIVRRKDAVSVVTRLKQEIDGTLQLGGPELATSLPDLIDEFWVYAFPVIVGGGKPYLPVREELPSPACRPSRSPTPTAATSSPSAPT